MRRAGVALVLFVAVSALVAFGENEQAPSLDQQLRDMCSEVDTNQVRQKLGYTGPLQKAPLKNIKQLPRSKKKGEAFNRRSGIGRRCFHAQHFEDLYLFQHFFHGIGSGTFVELGALDGYSYSVSFFFEVYQGWRGLLVEASPENHAMYRFRTGKLPPKSKKRRQSPFLHNAVCDLPRDLTFVSKQGTGAGILEFMPESEQVRNRKICKVVADKFGGKHAFDEAEVAALESPSLVEARGKDIVSRKELKLAGTSCTLRTIRCIHLGDVLRKHRFTHIDLFILDVEGAELEVLRTLRLDEIPVRFFLIELDGKSDKKDRLVRCLLRRHGYVPVGRLDLNELWHRKDMNLSTGDAATSPHRQVTTWNDPIVRKRYHPVSNSKWLRKCFVEDANSSFVHYPKEPRMIPLSGFGPYATSGNRSEDQGKPALLEEEMESSTKGAARPAAGGGAAVGGTGGGAGSVSHHGESAHHDDPNEHEGSGDGSDNHSPHDNDAASSNAPVDDGDFLFLSLPEIVLLMISVIGIYVILKKRAPGSPQESGTDATTNRNRTRGAAVGVAVDV